MANSLARKEIYNLRRKLGEYCQSGRKEKKKILKVLQQLEKCQMSLALLKETEIGISVNKLRKKFKHDQLGIVAKSLIRQWKKLVPDIKRPSERLSNRGSSTSRAGPSTSNRVYDEETDDPIRLKSRKLLAESLDSEDSRYKNRIRSRIVNLRDVKNPKLKENVLKGVITPEQFARMTSDEMASDEVKKMKEEMLRQSILDAQVPKTNLSSSDLFKCNRCGERDTTYNQVQTLSGDEPMTTFVACNRCGKRWKFN